MGGRRNINTRGMANTHTNTTTRNPYSIIIRALVAAGFFGAGNARA